MIPEEVPRPRNNEIFLHYFMTQEPLPVKKLSELQHFEPLGPQKGVTWSLGQQCWRAATYAKGKQKHMRFYPKDLSEAEVGTAWRQALAWREEQQKHRHAQL